MEVLYRNRAQKEVSLSQKLNERGMLGQANLLPMDPNITYNNKGCGEIEAACKKN